MIRLSCMLPFLGLAIQAGAAAGQSAAPEGWYRAGPPEALPLYTLSIDSTTHVGGRQSLRIKFTGSGSAEYGTVLAQSIKADDYRGSRIRLRGYARSADVSIWAGLWMRISGSALGVGFDNMSDRAIKGTSEWQAHEVVLDVSGDAQSITFGAIFNGTGTLWLDEFDVSLVGEDVPTTGGLRPAQSAGPDPSQLPSQPRNLNFESGREVG